MYNIYIYKRIHNYIVVKRYLDSSIQTYLYQSLPSNPGGSTGPVRRVFARGRSSSRFIQLVSPSFTMSSNESFSWFQLVHEFFEILVKFRLPLTNIKMEESYAYASSMVQTQWNSADSTRSKGDNPNLCRIANWMKCPLKANIMYMIVPWEETKCDQKKVPSRKTLHIFLGMPFIRDSPAAPS